MTDLARAAAPARVRGACPGVVDAMESADGWLMRVRTPGGRVSAVGLRTVADVSRRFGSGLVEITSRANLQIRGLRGPDLEAAATELIEAGLADAEPSVDARRSIVASPLAGHDATELVDISPLLATVLAGLATAELDGDLHPRFGIVLDGGGAGSVRPLPADVSLGAFRDDTGAVCRRLAIGRSLDAATSPMLLSPATGPSDLVELIIGITKLCAARSCRACDLAEEELPATARTLGRTADRRDPIDVGPLGTGRDPSGGLSGDGVVLERRGPASEPRVSEGHDQGNLRHVAVGRFEHPDERRTNVLASAFLGRMEASALARLADLAEAWRGAAELRLMPRGGIALVGLPITDLGNVLTTLADLGLSTDPTDPAHLVSACVGSPGCASSRADTLAAARTLVADADSLRTMGRVHLSGCEKRCGAPSTGTVLTADLVGSFAPDRLSDDAPCTKVPEEAAR